MRRNLVFALISLEVMLNAAGLAFIIGASRWGDVNGQVMFLMILTLAAAEVAVGLGLVLQLFRKHGTVDLDVLSEMKG